MLLCLGAWLGNVACADTFTLTDGQKITGVLVSPGDRGALIRQPNNQYYRVLKSDGTLTARIPWSRFSQEDLKRIMAKNKRAAGFAEPWVDLPPLDKSRERAFTAKEVTRLPRPQTGSFIGGFASSSIGLTILFVLYLANLYAAYEIATVRMYPWAMVCGVAALVPVIGPIVFLYLPTRMRTQAQVEADLYASERPTRPALAIPAVARPAGESEGGPALSVAAEPADAGPPPAQIFARGQFTFNRRFFETKFANFFGIVRREADKDMLLVFRTARGEFAAERINRIAANDLHVQMRRAGATEEVQVPFIEIKEVVLKHKDVP